jgi:hypothetical protein
VDFFTALGGFIQALRVHIDEGDDVVRERHGLGVGLAFAIRADDGEVQAFGGRVLAAKQKIRTGEGGGGETGGAAEEMAAGERVCVHEVGGVSGNVMRMVMLRKIQEAAGGMKSWMMRSISRMPKGLPR